MAGSLGEVHSVEGRMYKILLVDDDVAVTNYLMVFLMQTEDYEPTVINDSREIPPLLVKEHFDALLLDMDMPNISGMDILKLAKDKGIRTPIIVLTGVNDVELAVRAMKLGAFDYLTKPVDDQYLLEVLKSAISHHQVFHHLDQLPAGLKREDLEFAEAFAHITTQDPGMIQMLHRAEKMAAGDLSVFIWGERGTGKEKLARAIHNVSPRSKGPFVAVDVSAIPPDQLGPSIFGQARDWTGVREERPGFIEQAAGGTLFLDEIDCLPLPLQVRLKRILQTDEFYRESSTTIMKQDVRVIAASRHDLTSDDYRNTFSRDLLYHLMINSIQYPSLRDRPGDIPLLAEYFLGQEAAKAGKEIQGFLPESMEILTAYSYPDNMQELYGIVAGAVVNAGGELIMPEDLPEYLRTAVTSPAEAFKPRRLEEVEREHVAKVLNFFERDYDKASKALGVSVAEVHAIIGDSV
jgi:DNA-binding NtrC family response regulator